MNKENVIFFQIELNVLLVLLSQMEIVEELVLQILTFAINHSGLMLMD